MKKFIRIGIISFIGIVFLFPPGGTVLKAAFFSHQSEHQIGAKSKISSSGSITTDQNKEQRPEFEQKETAKSDPQHIETDQQNTENEKQTGKQENYIVEGKILYSGDRQKKQVALTFDDGPSHYYTDRVLDILKENDVKATFFLIGSHVEKYPETVKRITEEGHQIGGHSWSHKNFSKMAADEIRQELDSTAEIIDSAGGKTSNLFRPPYGSSSESNIEIIHEHGYNIVNWSVDSKDWAGVSVSRILSNVQSRLGPGSIILMHSSGKKRAMENMLIALPKIIVLVREQGYEFATVSEALDLRRAKESEGKMAQQQE